MAAITIIHGINNQRYGSRTRRAEWLPPLCDGIALAKGRAYPLPEDADVEVAFWGDLFRPKAVAMSGEFPPLQAEDLSEDGERELLAALVAHAQSTGDVAAPSGGAMGGGAPVWVQQAIWKLADTSFFRGLYGSHPEAMLVWGLKQVHAYMSDRDGVFERVQARVDEAIGDDTRVVIGHSLGTVVAYEALCRNPRNVTTLVTLGSPLGIPTLIYDRLRPVSGWSSHGGVRVRCRPDVKHWFNFSEPRDLIALVKQLAPLFEPTVRDYSISTGSGDAHNIVKHLTEAAVGEAIATGWPASPSPSVG